MAAAHPGDAGSNGIGVHVDQLYQKAPGLSFSPSQIGKGYGRKQTAWTQEQAFGLIPAQLILNRPMASV
jgi:hypothetical protein